MPGKEGWGVVGPFTFSVLFLCLFLYSLLFTYFKVHSVGNVTFSKTKFGRFGLTAFFHMQVHQSSKLLIQDKLLKVGTDYRQIAMSGRLVKFISWNMGVVAQQKGKKCWGHI